MAWLLFLLALGFLVLTLGNAWRMRVIERRWQRALDEQKRWMVTTKD
jgi:hypothetical protein